MFFLRWAIGLRKYELQVAALEDRLSSTQKTLERFEVSMTVKEYQTAIYTK